MKLIVTHLNGEEEIVEGAFILFEENDEGEMVQVEHFSPTEEEEEAMLAEAGDIPFSEEEE